MKQILRRNTLMLHVSLILLFAAFVPPANAYASLRGDTDEPSPYAHFYKDIPFDMPLLHRPTFPDHIANLINYGGIPDGITLNTKAFEDAFADLNGKGGGTLIIPAGVWFTGPIVFCSNVNMHLEKGAVIVFSPDFDLYPLVSTIYEGQTTRRCQSPISGRNLENVAITGEGVIDGSGNAWRPLKRSKVPEDYWKKVIQSGGALKDEGFWFPTEKSLRGEIMNANTPGERFTEQDYLSFKDYLRPVMVNFIECTNVFLEGATFQNSPSWNIHPLLCTNVIIDQITVRNPSYSQNGDGLDVESCHNVLILNSNFDVGDDGICIKSGKDEEGRLRARPTGNVIIDNCKVFQGHGGVVVGSEMSGGVRNIVVRNCQFLGTDVGLRFKAGRGRGGIVENIYIQDIYMFDIATEAFLFDLYYGGKGLGEPAPEVDETTPIFRNIHVKNLTARNVRRALFFNGLPEMNITDVTAENIVISSALGAEISESDGVVFRDIRIMAATGPDFLLHNVKNIRIENPSTSPIVTVSVSGDSSENIQIPGYRADNPSKK
jgi:polygalacturonase